MRACGMNACLVLVCVRAGVAECLADRVTAVCTSATGWEGAAREGGRSIEDEMAGMGKAAGVGVEANIAGVKDGTAAAAGEEEEETSTGVAAMLGPGIVAAARGTEGIPAAAVAAGSFGLMNGFEVCCTLSAALLSKRAGDPRVYEWS